MQHHHIERFLQEKSAWISRKLAYFKQFEAYRSKFPALEGLYSAHKANKDAAASASASAPAKTKAAQIAAARNQARTLISARILYFTTLYNARHGLGFMPPVGRISIRNQKTRWGSCSRRGTLNFNYRLALLPSHLADYIVVHELCHLKVFNHSDAFWALVAEVIPNYQTYRQELRIAGMLLR